MEYKNKKAFGFRFFIRRYILLREDGNVIFIFTLINNNKKKKITKFVM